MSANAVTQLVKKHKIGLFLTNSSDALKRIKKSTSLTLSMNPVETEYDYIADESPTTEVEDYKPSIDQDLSMYKGSEDYEMMWPYFYEMKTGSDAHTTCVIAFMQQPVDASGADIAIGTETAVAGYRAWKTDSVISVQDLNATDKKLDFKVIFGGGVTKGYVTVAEDGTPTFKTSMTES